MYVGLDKEISDYSWFPNYMNSNTFKSLMKLGNTRSGS